MNDSKLYRIVAAVLILYIALCMGAILILLAYGVSIPSGILLVLAGVIGFGLVWTSHLRMRMIFAAFRRAVNQSQARASADVSTVTRKIDSHAEEADSAKSSALDEALGLLRNQIDDCTREVVANDSFSALRHNELVQLANCLQNSIINLHESATARFDSLDKALVEDGSPMLVGIQQIAQNQADQSLRDVESSASREKFMGYMRVVKRDFEHSLSDILARLHSLRTSDELYRDSLISVVSELNTGISDNLVDIKEAKASVERVVSDGIRSTSADLEKLLGAVSAATAEAEVITKSQDAILSRLGITDAGGAAGALDTLVTKSDLDRVRELVEVLDRRSETGFARFAKDIDNQVSSQFESLRRPVDDLEENIAELIGSSAKHSSRDIESKLDSLTREIDSRFTEARDSSQLLFNAIQSKLQQLRTSAEELPKDLTDYSSLVQRFGVEALDMPRIGGWAATVPAITVMVQEILGRPTLENVLDIGSGASTVWSALAMRERGYGKCYALEHDPQFVSTLRTKLGDLGLERWAEVIYAPLVGWSPSFDYAHSDFQLPDQWYSLNSIRGLDLDAVFVDGPPGRRQELSRVPALESLYGQLRDDCLVVVDDTIRVEEKEIVSIWSEMNFEGWHLSVESQLSKSTALRWSRSI